MQLKTVAIASAVLIVGVGTCASLGLSASYPGTATARPVHQHTIVGKAPVAGRVFLSPAQLAEARASGTLDRPVRSLLAVNRQLQYGDYVWNDAQVPAGPTWIRIDLHSQLMSVFQAGHEIGTAVIVYGGDNKQTPTGKLHILAKAREHRSSLYDAEMPYTLRLTGDGVSIHGSNVRWGAATHGCIGVPLAFARRLFDATHVGDEVVVIPAPRTS